MWATLVEQVFAITRHFQISSKHTQQQQQQQRKQWQPPNGNLSQVMRRRQKSGNTLPKINVT